NLASLRGVGTTSNGLLHCVRNDVPRNSQIHKFTNQRIHEFTDSQIHKFTINNISRAYFSNNCLCSKGYCVQNNFQLPEYQPNNFVLFPINLKLLFCSNAFPQQK